MTQRTKPATLKQYGRAFRATSLSAPTDARIRAAIDEPRQPRQRWFPLAWATPLVAACALAALWARTSADSSACEVTEQVDHTRYAGRCDLDLEAMTLQLSPGAVVEERNTRVSLALGTAHFSVRKVQPGQPPVTIALPDASIEVLGTEFTVEILNNATRVHLHSGRVRFRHQGRDPSSSGSSVDMLPGQLLTFESRTGKTELVTLDASAVSDPSRLHDAPANQAAPSSEGAASVAQHPEASTEAQATDGAASTATKTHDIKPTTSAKAPSPAPVATTSAPPARSPTSELDEALRLRAAGRYEEALAALDDVNPQTTRAREVVDYERAALTEHTSPARACTRYRQHLVVFPQSRYRAAVLDKLTRCSAEFGSNAPQKSDPE